MGGGLGSEFLQSESAHASHPAPHPVPGVPSALGVALRRLRPDEARFACGSPRARDGGAQALASGVLGAPFPTLRRTFPRKAQVKGGGRVPPVRGAPRAAARGGSPRVPTPPGGGALPCSSAAAPAWRFAREPRGAGVRPGWVALSRSTENRGSQRQEKAARLLSQSQTEFPGRSGQGPLPWCVFQAFEVQTKSQWAAGQVSEKARGQRRPLPGS